ncbi:DUF2911 domain-containing protein [Leptobacterium flavescens]|uniref:DUF2911 domain-containing protein n=1 Tax=Leptobacterium flavescens TaxID=472055 RepID=A0A6P0UMV9_9FLAO|nr:DUF2911 domain-containing protein [Leptobacterium flavescens]NER12343.1 DUF2911 domain-containing protein [Leptobacterium flavescens]
MKKKLFTVLFVFVFTMAQAQINKASLSPQIKVEQNVGLAKISLEYGRPGAKDRKIFGSLIPYGKVWRTGANSSTKMHISNDLSLNGHKIPAGSYGLYSIPGEKEWTIIIHKNTNLWGAGGYNPSDDLIRFKVPVIKLKDKQETLNIGFENFNANGADLTIAWENSKVAIPVFVDSDALVYKEIEDKLINATGEIKAATYFDAAMFYYEKGKDLDLAAQWFDKAIELRPNAFWYIYYRAELAHQLKDKTTAEAQVKRSLELAKASSSGDYGYIAKCELLLEKIQKKS